MPSLYNCKHSGDQYRITKFDSDWNVEASYLCDLIACECPAGHRPKCRHREMLPKFIQRDHIGDEWFFDHDRGGWVQGASKELEEPYGIGPVMNHLPQIKADNEEARQELVNREANDPLLAPAGLGQPSEPSPSPLVFGGFPYDCYDTLCTTPADCIINGCVRGNGTPSRRLEPSPSPPSPTIRRRV